MSYYAYLFSCSSVQPEWIFESKDLVNVSWDCDICFHLLLETVINFGNRQAECGELPSRDVNTFNNGFCFCNPATHDERQRITTSGANSMYHFSTSCIAESGSQCMHSTF